MEFAKIVFDAFDKLLNKSQNEVVEIDGEEDVSILTDCKYSKTQKYEAVLDAYYINKGKRAMPVVVYLHGGGFVSGGKEYRTAIAKWLAVQGYFVINVNYGLCHECVFPEQFKHLSMAIKWLETNKEKYNLNLKKVVVAGDSAGAYYASMLACLSTSKKLQEKLDTEINIKFAGAILNCGLYDLQSVLERRLAFDLNGKIFESYTGIKKDEADNYKYKEFCSPLNLVNKLFPPTFLIYSEKDIFCAGQAEKLIEKFEEKDIYFESFCSVSPFVNHCFSLEWKSKQAQRANFLQSRFLDKIKKGSVCKKLSQAKNRVCEKM